MKTWWLPQRPLRDSCSATGLEGRRRESLHRKTAGRPVAVVEVTFVIGLGHRGDEHVSISISWRCRHRRGARLQPAVCRGACIGGARPHASDDAEQPSHHGFDGEQRLASVEPVDGQLVELVVLRPVGRAGCVRVDPPRTTLTRTFSLPATTFTFSVYAVDNSRQPVGQQQHRELHHGTRHDTTQPGAGDLGVEAAPNEGGPDLATADR